MLFARHVILDVQGLIEHPAVEHCDVAFDDANKANEAEAASGTIQACEKTQPEKAPFKKPTLVEAAPTESLSQNPLGGVERPGKSEQSNSYGTCSKATAEEPTPSKSVWVDGSESGMDYPEIGDESPRRLSKADRKRLRRQKQRNRAA